MDIETRKFFDAVIHITTINLYTLSKTKGGLIITNYSNTESHKCILKICKIAKDMFGIDIRINLPWYKYIYYILFTENKWCKLARKSPYDSVDINNLIVHMETANNYSNLYEKIYETYYKRG